MARKTQSAGKGVVWHGYPEAWDQMDLDLKKKWKKEGLVKRKHLRTCATREQVRDAFGGGYVGG